MSRLALVPTGKQRLFPDDQIIVSKTDPKGRITYVNSVFVDVSGYSEAELMGAAHSIIRHPDMPRCIYKLLWDTLESGHELFAYVVNLCKNGDHYWVFAHVTPTWGDGGRIVGHHSNRRTASAHGVAVAEGLYAQLRGVEARYPQKQDAVKAGLGELDRILAQAGQTYDEFVWSL